MHRSSGFYCIFPQRISKKSTTTSPNHDLVLEQREREIICTQLDVHTYFVHTHTAREECKTTTKHEEARGSTMPLLKRNLPLFLLLLLPSFVKRVFSSLLSERFPDEYLEEWSTLRRRRRLRRHLTCASLQSRWR